MTVTLQQLIEAAYASSVANDPGKLAGDLELAGVANPIFQALYALAAPQAPERYTTKTVLSLSGVPAVGSLSAGLLDLRRVQNSAGAKIFVIPVEEIDRRWHLAPAMYRQGDTLVSRGKTGDPVSGDFLTAFLLDRPSDLLVLASVVDARLPAQHLRIVTLSLAIYLSIKDGRTATDYGALVSERTDALRVFASEIGLSMAALTTPHGGPLVASLPGTS